VDFNAINTQDIKADWLTSKRISLAVLRLDKIHPVVSGNKWFKLKYYLQQAIQLQNSTIATFGGAWSNHIVATAVACAESGLKSVGIIRGEETAVISETLKLAKGNGMKLYFVSRELYREKEALKKQFEQEDFYWINEGGYGLLGAKGASEILKITNGSAYSHIIAAVGTGTMLAGLILAAKANQKVIGISSMKGNTSLEKQIHQLTAEQKPEAHLELIHDYHFGGYGKHPAKLIDYIGNIFQEHQLPLDIVYTGKTFFAIEELAKKGFFKPGSDLLMIHSGGLQGNKSLPHKLLAF
jgi:1-aminocyclopropane-1-carboxylate deaminase/D-cysteine desulfhydrase-like pyridoxal-dependent ACC family enzyme